MPPRLARLLAVLAAVALVGGAFAVRSALSGGDDSSTTGSDRARSGDGGDEPLRILCDTDLEQACAAVADLAADHVVETVPAGDALDRLLDGTQPWDAWVTLDPWPDMLALAAGPDRPVTVTEPLAAASGQMAVLVDPAASACTGATDWACLSSPADPPVGLAHPSTAFGALGLAHAAAALQDRVEFGINQLDDEVRVALEGILRAVRADGGRTVAEQSGRIVQSGYFSAVLAPAGRAEAVASSAQGQRRGLVVADIVPAVDIGVVVAGVGARGEAALDALGEVVTDQTVRDALAGEGWTGPAGRTSGLPDPGLIFALQEQLS